MKDRTLTILALLIIAQRLLFILFFPPVMEPDSALYANLGQLLSSGLGFDSAVRLPGYPAFLAVCYRLFGQTGLPVIILQHALAVGLFFIFRALLPDRRSKIIFSLLFLCDILYASYQHAILTESLFSFLLCISAIEFHNYTKTGKLPHLLACGALVAAGIFTKPVLKFFPLIVLALLLADRKPLIKKAAAAAVFLLIPLLAINLWSWRNYVQHGKFSLLTFESLHYTGRLVNHIEFPENSLTKEIFLRNIGPGWIPMNRKAAITFATINELRQKKGLTDAQINTEFQQIYVLSIVRHPFIYAKETATEVFYFFFSAHNLFAKHFLKWRLPYSVTEAFLKGDFTGLALKLAISMHPFYWLLFLLTAFFTVTRWRALLAVTDSFASYGLALIIYISGVTSMANEGLANYRCPIQPFMLFFSALVISAWLGQRESHG